MKINNFALSIQVAYNNLRHDLTLLKKTPQEVEDLIQLCCDADDIKRKKFMKSVKQYLLLLNK